MPITLKITDPQTVVIATKRGWTPTVVDPADATKTIPNPITAKEFVIKRYFEFIFKDFAEIRKENDIENLNAQRKITDEAIQTTKEAEAEIVKNALLS